MVKIKNSNIRPVIALLDSLRTQSMPPTLALKFLKIKKKLESELSTIMEATQITDPVYRDYLMKYNELLMKYCKKDESGKPVITDSGQFVFETAADKEAFLKAVDELQESDPEGARISKQKEEELAELLNQETCIPDVDPISVDELERCGVKITLEQMETLYEVGVII